MLQKSKNGKRQEYAERVALELYHKRLLLGQPGDDRSDWAKAEQIVRSPIRTTLFASKRQLSKLRKLAKQAFKFLVWDTPNWFLFTFPKLELVKLLAVPLVLAVATSIITGQLQSEASQNASLKAYFDSLEKLTFEQNLLDQNPNEGAIVLARGRTVAALRELDLSRRAQLIAFLQASDLSQKKEDSAAPVISFEAQNLSSLDLRGVNLSGLDFQNATLRSAKLQGADLYSSNLGLANLLNANLKKANLLNADLGGAKLNSTNLEGAKLNNADLRKATLNNANLKKADLGGADLEGATLNNANLEGATLNANFEGAKRIDTNLRKATLNNANLKKADLGGANFEGATLNNANLEGATLGGANFEGAKLNNANLAGTNLNGSIFDGADLSFVNLEGAELNFANLKVALNLNQDQLSQALICHADLPDDITLDPNRACDEY